MADQARSPERDEPLLISEGLGKNYGRLAACRDVSFALYSGEVLVALVRSGISREDAYAISQRCAMATWTKLGTPEGQSFRANLEADPDVIGRVSAAELDAAFDPALHMRSVDRIFERVFGSAH